MTRYIYRIDEADQIEFVNPEWLDFARENEAQELTRPSVLGASLWNFIEGAETRILYESMFSRLRAENKEMIIPFRCDSPSMIRLMELTLRSMSRGRIEMEGRLLERKEREYHPLLDPGVSRSEKEVAICSLCRRILVAEEEWKEVETAVVRLRLFSRSKAPRLMESVCPLCRDRVFDAASLK